VRWAGGMTVFEGVAEQVVENAAQVFFGKHAGLAAVYIHFELGAGFGKLGQQVLAHVFDHGGQQQRCSRLGKLGLQLGDVGESTLQQMQQAFDVGNGCFEVVRGRVNEIIEVYVSTRQLLICIAKLLVGGR
nr:hypothetical protein [Tanacetum cinerariifolium]